MIEGKKIVAPAAAAVSAQSVPRRPPLWMWPHLLSLDAPLVAMAWQSWWAHTQGVPLRWFHQAILGLAVWMIYLADRLADGFRAPPAAWGTPRHALYHRRRTVLATLLGIVIATLVAVAPVYLDAREFRRGIVLLGVAGVYFWLNHGRRGWTPRVPKESVVGALFAVGVSFFVACRGVSVALAVETALFGALCFLNCALITRWEHTLQDRREQSSLLNAFPRVTARLPLGALGLAAGAGLTGLFVGRSWALAPLTLAAAGLWVLDRVRGRVPADALRVLADVALLAPWLFLAAG